MKKLLLILLCFPFIIYGQNDNFEKINLNKSSQSKEITELRNEINSVKYNLNLHHQQFSTGIIVSIIGVTLTIAATAALTPATPALTIAGGVISLIGYGMMIDSDKYFGKKYINKNLNKLNKESGYFDEYKENNTQKDGAYIKIEIQHPNRTIRHILKNQITPIDEVEIIIVLKNGTKMYNGNIIRFGLSKLSIINSKNEINEIKYKNIAQVSKINKN